MIDELEVAKESAKAVQEVAKTGRAVIEAGSDLAGYVAKALGTVPEDLVGLALGDYLRVKRIENATSIFRKAQERLSARGAQERDPIDAKHIQPLLEAISVESNETLRDMWANLLANTMDPNSPVHLERVLMDTLRQFEPLDATALIVAHNQAQTANPVFDAELVSYAAGVRLGRAFISLSRLCQLECLNRLSDDLGPESDFFEISYLGKELLLSCSPEAPTD